MNDVSMIFSVFLDHCLSQLKPKEINGEGRHIQGYNYSDGYAHI